MGIIGNAVAIEVAQKIGEALIAHCALRQPA
jgi:hypothetical protein